MLERKVYVDDLMAKLNRSVSELENFKKAINHNYNKELIITDGKYMYLDENSKSKIYKTYFQDKQNLFFYHDVDERLDLIQLKLSVSNKFLSLQYLADVCLVSKNTILNDLKIIRSNLKGKGLNVNYSRKQGYSIIGSEFTIRNLMVSSIKNILDIPAGRLLLEEKGLLTESEIFLVRKRLEKVESRIGIKLTDEQLDELPYILQLIVKRAYKLNSKWTFKVEDYDIKNTLEFPEINNMFWDYEFLNQNDLLYLSLQILSSNMVESALHISDGNEIIIATYEFIRKIEGYLAIDISRKFELQKKIILHMRPAIYRNLMGFQINNPLADEFTKEYPEIYNIVLKSVEPFEKIVHHNLSKEEVVYLSMIVLSWIYETEETNTIFTAVVLCQNGTSISKLLLETLKSMFPSISFIGSYSIRQFQEKNKSVDFIFTNKPIKSSTTTFIIPSILDKKSRIDLKKRVSKEMKGNKSLTANKLLSSIIDFIPKENVDVVSDRVRNFFESDKFTNIYEDDPPKGDYFNFLQDNISIVENYIEWKDLVSFSMKPLLNRDSIDQSYVDEVNNTFYTNHKQMIIAPDVYIPHANPKFGVKNMDFQILIFRKPINTPENKKVKLVVALAPSKENNHVSTLIKLSNLLSKPEIRNGIAKSESVLYIKKILNTAKGEK